MRIQQLSITVTDMGRDEVTVSFIQTLYTRNGRALPELIYQSQCSPDQLGAVLLPLLDQLEYMTNAERRHLNDTEQ